MATDAVLQVRIDSNLKASAEELYNRFGITVAEAVRMFLAQSVEVQGLPFELKSGSLTRKKLFACGIASKYADPSKIHLEKDAWEKAVAEKYENTRR